MENKSNSYQIVTSLTEENIKDLVTTSHTNQFENIPVGVSMVELSKEKYLELVDTSNLIIVDSGNLSKSLDNIQYKDPAVLARIIGVASHANLTVGEVDNRSDTRVISPEVFGMNSKYYEGEVTKSQLKEIVIQVQPSSNLNRNSSCECGSGLKYKKCCLNK